MPHVRANGGEFNTRDRGAKIWCSMDESTKSLTSTLFRLRLRHISLIIT